MDSSLFEVIVGSIRAVSKRTQTMTITPNSVLVDDLALDSLDIVGVLMKLEDHYALKIELDDVGNLRTVSDLEAHVAKLLGENSAAA